LTIDGMGGHASGDTGRVNPRGIYETFTLRRAGVDAKPAALCHASSMTKLLLPSLLAALGAFSTLTAQDAPRAVPAAADPTVAPAKPAPATPPGDPFVRDLRAPKPPAPAPAPAPAPVEAPVNLLTTVETWALSQADFATLLDGPADGRAPYDRLEALAKAGLAKLTGLIAVSTKTGQRAVVESVDEVRYASEFSRAERAGEIAFPTVFETRNVGDTLEIEPVIGPDGKTIDVNLIPQSQRLDGFQDWQPEASAAPMSQPQIRTEKVTTNTTVFSGRPTILATATPSGTGDEKGAKQVRLRALRVTAQPVPPSPPVADEVIDAGVELSVFSLDREAARRLLHDTADSVQSYAAVRALVAKGEAQLEAVSTLVTKSGQRAINEEIAEFRYPTTASGPRFDSQTTPKENRQPASWGDCETRSLGVTLEIEPVFGPQARFVDANLVPQIVSHAGQLKASGVAAKYPPQPIFTRRQLTTSVSSGAGVPVLLGTMSQPRDNGVNDRKDDGRTSLAYIRVTAVRP
jgi:Bacterial type II and III secretion system protein